MFSSTQLVTQPPSSILINEANTSSQILESAAILFNMRSRSHPPPPSAQPMVISLVNLPPKTESYPTPVAIINVESSDEEEEEGENIKKQPGWVQPKRINFEAITRRMPPIEDLVDKIDLYAIKPFSTMVKEQCTLRHLTLYEIKANPMKLILLGYGFKALKGDTRNTSIRFTRVRQAFHRFEVTKRQQFMSSNNPVIRRIWADHVPEIAKKHGNQLQSFMSDLIIFSFNRTDLINIVL